MSSRPSPPHDAGSPPATDLFLALEAGLPASIEPGQPTGILCAGYCFHRRQRVTRLRLQAGDAHVPPTAFRMPRRDLYDWFTGPHGGDADPLGHSYRSGFWAILSVPAQTRGAFVVRAEVELEDGSQLLVILGEVPVTARAQGEGRTPDVAEDVIAICMATFQPDLNLFAVQIESLRAQTDESWTCVISDAGSEPEHWQQMLAVLAGDDRFTPSRSPARLSPYRNFERVLSLAPRRSRLIALCDQDDHWYADKLAVLRSSLGSHQLVYSDLRLVDASGRVLRDSLWTGRRHDRENLTSLLVANTAPGAAMLFRREVAERALPFPDLPGSPYHDHWLALVALASGSLGFVDRPLYDYVQHGGAVQGSAVGDRSALARSASGSRGWRAAYFGGYLPRRLQAEVLLHRAGPALTARKGRALRWFSRADRSPAAFAWLAARPLRRFMGRDETLGGELPLIFGIAWRWLIALAAGGREQPGRCGYETAFPDPPAFEQRRLRRWRTGS